MPSKKRMIVRSMVNLQRAQLAARDQLAALTKAPESAWSGLKVDLDKAMDQLTKAVVEVKGRIK